MVNKLFIGENIFNVLVAISDEEQRKGLMFREWPPPVMVFPYKTAEVRKFWMKNTISPLDIVFCNNNCIIDICKGEAMSTCLVGPNKPVNFVVELPYGTVQKLGIKIGQTIKFRRSAETIKKLFS